MYLPPKIEPQNQKLFIYAIRSWLSHLTLKSCVPNFTFFSLVDLEKTGSDRQTDTK